MRSFFILLFLLMVSLAGAQNSNPSASIMLNGHSPADFKDVVGTLHNAQGIKVLSHQNPVITFEYASEAERVAAMQELYTRDFSITTKNGIPVDFPRLAPNANEAEQAAFEQQKSEWISNNPERYEEMLNNMQQNNGVTVISQEEFDQMPANKQQHILDHPELYSIE